MRHPWVNRVVLPVGVLVAYFCAPMSANDSPLGVIAGTLLAAAGLGSVVYVVIDEARRAEKRLLPIQLLLMVELSVVIFAWVNYAVALHDPTQFVGLKTRLDALYFSMTTVSTVGYGDVSAAGQLARGLVLLQLVFNIGFVAAIVGMIRETVASKRRGG